MKRSNKEIAGAIEDAIEEITRLKKKGKLTYDQLGELIAKTAVKYDISEGTIRSVGSWNLSSPDRLINLWLEAEEEGRNGNDNECNRLKNEFAIEYETLRPSDKENVDEYLASIAG